ncbi:MAG: hypothetical protein ABIQ73_14745 [Acidimicrobiales bacterium]
MFVRNRGFKLSAFGALVIAGLIFFQSVASAHHPEIEATPVCVAPTTARITVTATAWTTPEADHRINNNVVVTIAGQTFNGAFTAANSYQFSVFVDVPANGATYVARATAVTAWGPNGEFGSAGEFRETSVTAPPQCVEGGTTTTTTTSTTTSTTTTTAPPTTAPPTTIPPTTIPPTTAPPTTTPPTTPAPTTAAPTTVAPTIESVTTTAPPTTIGVQVGGIIEERVSTGVLARTGNSPVRPWLVVGLSLVVLGAFIELRARARSKA